MPGPDKKEEEKTVKVRFPLLAINIRILIFAVLVAGTAVFLRPLQQNLRERIEGVRNTYIRQAEEFLGRRIDYSSMGPSIFGTLDIRNVLVLREDNSVSLSIDRLRFSFSIIDILRGDIRNAFKSVRIDRPVLNLDFEKDADLARRFASARTNGGASSPRTGRSAQSLIPENFTLRIWNGEWDLSGSVGTFKLQGVGFDAAVREDRVSFHGRWNADASLARRIKIPAFLGLPETPALEAVMNGRISGEYEGGAEEGSATISFPSVSGDFFRIRPLSVSFFLSGNRLEARKAYDQSPVTFSLVYDTAENTIQGRYEGEKFSLDDTLEFTGPWRVYNPSLAFEISGNADFIRENSGYLKFGMDFSGAGKEGSPLENALLDLRVLGDGDLVTIEAFDIRSPYGDLVFEGGLEINPGEFIPAAPFGFLSLSNFRLRGDKHVSGDLSLRTNDRKINVSSEDFRVGDVALFSLGLSLDWDTEALNFDFSALRSKNAGFSGDTRTGLISLYGSAGNNPDEVRAELRLDSFAAGDLFELLEPFVAVPVPPPVRAVAGDLFVSTEASLASDYTGVSYDAPLITAAYEGLQNITAEASVSGTDRGIALSGGTVSWENGSVEISGSVDYSNTDDIAFSMDTSFGGLPYFFEGSILDKRNVSVRGSHGFQVYLSGGEAGSYSGYAQGEKIPFLRAEDPASLSFLFSLAYNSASSWRAGIEKFEIANLATPVSSSALLRFTGAADERGLNIPNFFFDDGQGALGGTINLAWDPSYEDCRFRTDISGNARSELYNLNGIYRNKRLELFLSGRGMQFSRFTAKNITADGTFRLLWESPASFEAESVISSFIMRTRDETLRASGSITLDDERLVSRQLAVNYAGLEFSVPSLVLNRSASRAETEARVWGVISEMPVDLRLRGDVSFGASSTWFDLLRDFGSLDGSIAVSSARFNDIEAKEPFSFTFNCKRAENGYAASLAGGPRNMLRLRYADEASGGVVLYAALSAPSPVRGTFTASINSGVIDAQTSDLYADMGALWRFVPPNDVIGFSGGIVTGSIKAAGPLRTPEFTGTAKGSSLKILVPQYFSEPIRPVPVTLNLTGSEITFGPVDAVVGQGGGKVSGWFRFDEWIPNTMNIDISVPPNRPVPYDLDISGLLAQGLASGNILLALEDLVLTVSGDITGYDTEISLNANELSFPENGQIPIGDEDAKISVITDLSIRAGRRVEFFWPSADLPVLQAYADLGTGIRITSDTLERRFSLSGDVRLRGGEIFYLERNFYIREGTLFFRESETQFDPLITARAEIRDQAETGPVTISMIIDNAPLRSFSPRFVSMPPLSQMEIYSLLGQVPQNDGEQRNLATSAIIDGIAQFTVINRLQRQVRNFLGLDMLSLRTQLLQNVVLRTTGGWSDSVYRAGNYFDNSTIFVGKYFGSELFVEGLISFKYDENQTDWGGLVLEPELGFEMTNPLFDIHFNMTPLHPENLFIDDISFSLIWRRTF